MTGEPTRADELSPAELAHQDGTDLPTREAMTLISPGLLSATPVPLDGSAGQAADFAGQSSTDAASVTDATITDTAAQPQDGAYSPAVTNVARS